MLRACDADPTNQPHGKLEERATPEGRQETWITTLPTVPRPKCVHGRSGRKRRQKETDVWEAWKRSQQGTGKNPAADEAGRRPDDEQADGREGSVGRSAVANRMRNSLEAEFERNRGHKLKERLHQQLQEDLK